MDLVLDFEDGVLCAMSTSRADFLSPAAGAWLCRIRLLQAAWLFSKTCLVHRSGSMALPASVNVWRPWALASMGGATAAEMHATMAEDRTHAAVLLLPGLPLHRKLSPGGGCG